MRGLLIAGAGGHGCVVAETAQAIGHWGRIAFLDDQYESLGESVLSMPVLGGLDLAESFRDHYAEIVVAIGNGRLRSQWMQRYSIQGFGLPVLVHPTAWISPSAKLARCCMAFSHAVVSARASAGDGCIINTAATVDHDCVLGEFVHICPGAHIAGDVYLDEQCWVGIGANVVQGVHVGSGTIIGAGAVVIANVEDKVTVAGVPAKVIRSHG